MMSFFNLNKYLLIGALAFTVAAYAKGRVDGRAISKSESLQATFEQLKERNDVNETVRNFDDDELCTALGGELLNNECV